jgi:hypothetical protein
MSSGLVHDHAHVEGRHIDPEEAFARYVVHPGGVLAVGEGLVRELILQDVLEIVALSSGSLVPGVVGFGAYVANALSGRPCS